MTLVWGCLVTCVSLNVVSYFFWKYFQSVFLYTSTNFYVTLNHSWGPSIGPGSRFVHFPIFTISGCAHRNLTNCSIRVLWTYNKKNYGIETLFIFSISASVITLRINENISIELLLFTLIQIHLPSYKTNNFNLDWVYQYSHWTHFHTLSIAEVYRILCVYMQLLGIVGHSCEPLPWPVYGNLIDPWCKKWV